MDAQKCIICSTLTTNRCSGCKSVRYCSKACEETDHPLHKLLCKKFVTFLATPPPNPIPSNEDSWIEAAYKLALFFPKDAKFPQLIWLKRETHSEYEHDEEDEEGYFPSYHNYQTLRASLSEYIESPESPQVPCNDHELRFWVGAHSLGGEDENCVVGALNAGFESCERGATTSPFEFAGNLIVTSSKTIEYSHPEFGPHEQETFGDITLADLRHAVNYFSRRNYLFESEKVNPFVIRNPSDWIKGVRVSCSGDMTFMDKKKYRQVEVSRDNPIFGHHDICSISKQMGIPLLVKSETVAPEWRGKIHRGMRFDPCENRAVRLLMFRADVEDWHNWGSVDAFKWDNGIDKTALFVREDHKDLTPQHVEALVEFCDQKLVLAMIPDGGLMARKDRERVVRVYMKSSKFDDFFDKLKMKKLAERDLSWTEAVSPRQI
jgi:hypothetical protein